MVHNRALDRRGQWCRLFQGSASARDIPQVVSIVKACSQGQRCLGDVFGVEAFFVGILPRR